MTDVEKIKEIFEAYYKRDGNAKEDGEDFYVSFGDKAMNTFYQAIPELEEKTGKKFPEQYKAFIEAGVGYEISTIDGEPFLAYTENDILYFHNYYNEERRLYQKLSKCLVIGQNGCDDLYFMDVNNVLGYGPDCVWKAPMVFDKKLCQIVGRTFIEFLENYLTKEHFRGERPFFFSLPNYDMTLEDPYETLQRQIKADPALFERIERDKKYITETFKKVEEENKGKFVSGGRIYLSCDIDAKKKKTDHSLRYLEKVVKRFPVSIPPAFLSMYEYFGKYSIENKNVEICFSLISFDEFYEEDEYVIEDLKKMLFIGFASGKFVGGSDAYKDGQPIIFIDISNLLGHGNEVIYEISVWAEKIDNACIIAENYCDLIRKIYEEEEIPLIPINHGLVK